MNLHRAGLIFSFYFVIADMLFFAVLWIIGSGYVSMEPQTIDQMLTGSTKLHIWNMLHAPVNEVFGPHIFPYFSPHGGFSAIFSLILYVMLCFTQMFFVGYLVYWVGKRVKFFINSYT